jgi:hypothetical protein
MTQSLRALLASEGVTVHGVVLGPVDTDMNRGLEIPKASPESVAAGIFDGLARGDEESFRPDRLSSGNLLRDRDVSASEHQDHERAKQAVRIARTRGAGDTSHLVGDHLDRALQPRVIALRPSTRAASLRAGVGGCARRSAAGTRRRDPMPLVSRSSVSRKCA